jgi:hypothetical protein
LAGFDFGKVAATGSARTNPRFDKVEKREPQQAVGTMEMKFRFTSLWKTVFSRKFLSRFGLLLLIAYLAFGAYFYCCDQGDWLTEPNSEPSSAKETNFDHLPMKLSPSADDVTDQAVVHYRRYAAWSGPVKGTVLYFHGNKGNMQKCELQIEIFLQKGYDVWTMDYREFGDSTGELSERALVGDAKRVYDEIVLSGVNENDIVIWGRSFGSGAAASIVAADTKPKMLVLETPYWSLPDTARSNYLLLPDFLFHYQLPIHEYLSRAKRRQPNLVTHALHRTLDGNGASSPGELPEGGLGQLHAQETLRWPVGVG